MRFIVVFVMVFAGCRDGEPAKKQAPADPWATSTAKPQPQKPKRSARERADAAVARVDTIVPKVAKLRGLAAKAKVPAEYQTTDDFRAYMRRELAKELPREKTADVQAAQYHIGLFTKPVDLSAVIEQTMISQVAAYYDPAPKKFFVVMTPESDDMFDMTSAHELTHALQDQHFDLDHYLPSTLDDDASHARKFVVEGDATFTMLVYATGQGDKVNKQGQAFILGLMKTQIEGLAAMTVADYAASMKSQAAAFSDMDPDLKKSMDTIGELPPIIIGPMMSWYMKGAVLAMAAFERGGWPAVDDLYVHPPESTEQVLHPRTKLYPDRDHPHHVTLPKLGGKELVQNVIGELQWSIYFEQWNVKKPEAAMGWGGDRYAVLRQDDGSLVGVIVTTWDAEQDASEFYDAYLASLAARFPKSGSPTSGMARGDHGKVFVQRTAKNVYILDGALDDQWLARLSAETKID